MDKFDLINFIALCGNRMRADGFCIEAARDNAEFEARMATIGKKPSHPMMSSYSHDFTAENFIGLLVTHEGFDVGGVAAKIENVGSEYLSGHIARTHSRHYNDNEGPPAGSFPWSLTNEIRGSLVCLGELFMHPDYRRGRVNLAVLMHYHNTMCATIWSPDWIYGFVRQPDVLTGKASRYGFTRQYAGCQTWTVPEASRYSTEYLVALTYQDVVDAARFYLKNPDAFAPNIGYSDQASKQ